MHSSQFHQILVVTTVMMVFAGCAQDPPGAISFDRSDKTTAGGRAETCDDLAQIANNARQGFINSESDAISRVDQPSIEALATEIARPDIDAYQLDILFFRGVDGLDESGGGFWARSEELGCDRRQVERAACRQWDEEVTVNEPSPMLTMIIAGIRSTC